MGKNALKNILNHNAPAPE